MVAYTYQMPSGIPGTVTRYEQSTIEAQMLNPSSLFPGFGLPCKMVSGLLTPIGAGDNSASIVGFLAKPYPTSGNGVDGLGVAAPNVTFPADLLTRGYMNVQVNGATAPVKEGTVYVRTANPSTGKPVGGIEAVQEWAASVAAHAGNTGNGVFTLDGTTPVLAGASAGVYNVTCIAAASNSGTFQVQDPNGFLLSANYVVAGTFADQIKFVIADGSSDFVVGDSFQVTVVANTFAITKQFTHFTGGEDANGNSEIAFNI